MSKETHILSSLRVFFFSELVFNGVFLSQFLKHATNF